MNDLKLSQSQRKFIRKEKSRIRRSLMDVTEQQKAIKALYPAVKKA
jgi:hypothetical protein